MGGFRLVGLAVTVTGLCLGIATAQVTTAIDGRTVPYIPKVLTPETIVLPRPNTKPSARTEPTAPTTGKTNACPAFLRTDPDVLRTVNGYAQGSARNPRITANQTVDFISATIRDEVRNTTPAVVNRNPSLFYESFKHIDRATIANCWPTLNAVIVEKERKDAIEGEAQRQRQMAQEQQEREAQAASEDRRRKQAAIDALPSNKLRQAYRSYILIRKCFDARKGFAAVYINDVQFKRAKTHVVAIESALKASEPSIDTDTIWKSVSRELADAVEMRWITSPQWLDDANDYCRMHYNNLADEHIAVVPEAKIVKKDF